MGLAVGLAAMGATGCATKNWVHTQTAPLVEHTGQLEEKTATNNRDIRDVDDRAQAGVSRAQGAADAATRNAQDAAKAAGMPRHRQTTLCIAQTRWTAW